MSLSVLAAAAEVPAALALLATGERLTYAAAAAEVRRALRWLATRGAAPGVRVAFVARPDMPTALLTWALGELGAVAVPLHPRLSGPERAHQIAAARPQLVLDDLAAARAAWSVAPPDRRAAALVPDDERPLALLATSGTSGRPRGVVLSRAAFVAAARASAANLGWRPWDRWLLCLPPAHVGGLSVLTRCLAARRAVVLGDGPLTGAALRRMLQASRVTLLSLVPTLLQRLLEDEPAWTPPPWLRAVLLGGAPAPAPLLAEAARRGVPVLCTYGLTEACAQVATQRPGTRPDAGEGCGPPLPGVSVRIVAGEIQVRGPSLLLGYDEPGGLRSPLLPGGWLATGDLGRLDAQGRLHVLGRRGDLIITGGENVHPAEVEASLLAVPGVRAACVFGVPDDRWGEVVAAALVAHPIPADAELAAQLAVRLGGPRRPRRIAYLAEIPTTPTGKPDRRAAAAAARLRPLRYD